MAKKASASIALVFMLLYITFQGASSSDHDEAQIEALITELSESHPSKRLAAQKALRKIGKPAAPALGHALKHEDPEVRYGAVQTLRKIGPDADAALPDLIAALEDDMIRSDAARALEAIGPAAMPYLVDTLESANRNVRSKAIFAVGSIAEDGGEAGEAVGPLIDLMRNPDSAGEPDWPHDKQLDALKAISKSRPPDIADGWKTMAKANEMIMGGAAYGSAEERDALMIALDKARQQMMRSNPAFRKALEASRPRGSLRPNIARTLGDIGAPAVPGLLALLVDVDSDLRKMSTIAFQEMGEEINDDFDEPMDIGDEAEPAIAGLTQALADEDADVQAGAVNALAAFGDASISALIAALEDAEMIRRANAAKALGKIEPAAEDAVPALTAVLEDDHAEVRRNAVQALTSMGTAASSAAPRLGEALVSDDDPKVRRLAVEALGLLADESTISMLVEAIGDDDRHVRRVAAESLYALGEASIPALVQALGHEDELVRTNAEELINWYLAADPVPALVEALESALDDDQDDVKARAKELLELHDQRLELISQRKLVD